jgi:hypothetical protein
MKKSEWSDNELEQLLRQMPKIKDHRDPRDIYQSLSLKANKRKKPVWIIPSIASVAAVLLLLLLGPNVWQSINPDNDLKQESVAQDSAIDSSNGNMEMTKIAPNNEDSSKITQIAPNNNEQGIGIMGAAQETAIYEEDVVDQQVVTYMIPDQNAQILVPVSVLVPKDNGTWLENFQSYSDKLTETQWGLTDYYPLNATLSMVDEQTMNVNVPEDHLYGNGSASETSFISIMEETINRQNTLQKITLSTNGNPGMMFGNYGEVAEVNRPITKKRSYYLFNPTNQNLPFIVPGISSYSNIESALGSMMIRDEIYGLEPSMTNSFKFKVDTNSKEMLIITFEDKVDLTDEPKNIYAIEAILLTAKEFGYKSVKFENSPTPQIGRFNLQNEIKVPIAPNKVFLP